MQIRYKLDVVISLYIILCLSKKYPFPAFFNKCPICGARNCAIKIGFYYRNVYSTTDKKVYLKIPIQRYLCQRRNKVTDKKAHRTFSLLPYPIIPYKRYDIDVVMFAARQKYIGREKMLNIALNLAEYLGIPQLDFFIGSILSYLQIFEIAQARWESFKHKIVSLLDIPLTELKAHVFHYYDKTGQFLFGIPSQDRF